MTVQVGLGALDCVLAVQSAEPISFVLVTGVPVFTG